MHTNPFIIFFLCGSDLNPFISTITKACKKEREKEREKEEKKKIFSYSPNTPPRPPHSILLFSTTIPSFNVADSFLLVRWFYVPPARKKLSNERPVPNLLAQLTIRKKPRLWPKFFFEMDRNPISPLKNWDVTPAWTNKWTWKSTVLPDLEPVILVHQCKMDSPNRRSVPLHLPKPPPLSLTPFVGCNQKKPIKDQSKEPEERKKEKKEKKDQKLWTRTLELFPISPSPHKQ